MQTEDKCIMAVDPGRDKCGLAVVDFRGTIHTCRVVPREKLPDEAMEQKKKFSIGLCVVGNGTTGQLVEMDLKIIDGLEIVLVDEKFTTEEARNRYWKENPPQGWRKIWPLGLQSPPEPVDGYVAVILAERYLAALKKQDEKAIEKREP